MKVKQELYENWADQWLDEVIAGQEDSVQMFSEDLEDYTLWMDTVSAQHLGDAAAVAAWEAEQMVISMANDYCPF